MGMRIPPAQGIGIDEEEIFYAKGGPTSESKEEGLIKITGAVQNTGAAYREILENEGPKATTDGSLLGVSSPLSNIEARRNGVKIYKVQEGDTLSEIAAGFGVSLDTIRWGNPGLKSFIRVGQDLTILPVNGIVYEVADGDSLESVASKFRILADQIIRYNPDHQKLFDVPGSQVVLPNARPLAYARNAPDLPDLRHYFILPARGWNWGTLHHDNAVDIADKCGSPIHASAEGLVKESSVEGFWNQGYGNYVLIEHPNGTETKYAHIEGASVRVGDYVAQGDKVASIGNTGKTHGPTGCHLHFEVAGARNPFAIR